VSVSAGSRASTSDARRSRHHAALHGLADWEPYLREHSGLPGPRADLELLDLVAEEATPALLWRLTRSEHEFLAACGAAGLGRLAAEGDSAAVQRLRGLADDPRWRVREGVAMGLQRIGEADPGRLLAIVEDWATGSPLVRRAAVAGLCEPRLLEDPPVAAAAVRIHDEVTASLLAEPSPSHPDVRVLRQALGYCWSVAIVAAPAPGRVAFEHMCASDDPDLRWIVRSNLGKARLRQLDATWVEQLAAATHAEARERPAM
jgi:hypothetical protein